LFQRPRRDSGVYTRGIFSAFSENNRLENNKKKVKKRRIKAS
jgi:hypothetical protein